MDALYELGAAIGVASGALGVLLGYFVAARVYRVRRDARGRFTR